MTQLNVTELRPLIAPAVLRKELPTPHEIEQQVITKREQISAILTGQDTRLLVVVGPCSIHDNDAALEYAGRLAALQNQYKEQLCIVMRVYFEKPRTSGGWKGLINDPNLDQSFDINFGLHKARKLLLDINQLGIAAGTEFIDVIIPPFISDLVSWGAIGARTTESQIHRQLASGLPMPVGFKNGTTGNTQIAIDAVRASKLNHQYLGITEYGTPAIFETHGNPYGHIILRGATDHTNYEADKIATITDALLTSGLPPFLMVDCSHGNSNKDHTKQPAVAQAIVDQIAAGNGAIAGVMIESHLTAGKQQYQPGKALTYGQSITDACIDWNSTTDILQRFANSVATRQEQLSAIS